MDIIEKFLARNYPCKCTGTDCPGETEEASALAHELGEATGIDLDALAETLNQLGDAPWQCDGFGDGGFVSLSVWEGDPSEKGNVPIVDGIGSQAMAELIMGAREVAAALLKIAGRA